jgi:hypothetical protein
LRYNLSSYNAAAELPSAALFLKHLNGGPALAGIVIALK